MIMTAVPAVASTVNTGTHLIKEETAGEIHPGGRPDQCLAAKSAGDESVTPLGAQVVTIPCADTTNDYYVNWILVRYIGDDAGSGGQIETLVDPSFCIGFGQRPLVGGANRRVVIQSCDGTPSMVFGKFAGQWALVANGWWLSVFRNQNGNATWQRQNDRYVQFFVIPAWPDNS